VITISPAQRRAGETLAASATARLPGLAAARDADHARRVVARLLPDGTTIRDVRPASFWWRNDTCLVRYRVQLDDRADLVVLGEVHATPGRAERHLSRTVLQAPAARAARTPPRPWRRWGTVDPDASLVVHPFPLDPALPSLATCLDPAAVSAIVPGGIDLHLRGDVTVVHHPRTGPCVLRYDGGAAGPVYGKVYDDEVAGPRVHAVLRALAHPAFTTDGVLVRFPTAITYEPRLRLLLTGAVAGVAELPARLRDVPIDATGDAADEALLAAAVAAGRGLAAVHAQEVVAAPVRTLEREARDLRRLLASVALCWPAISTSLRGRLAHALLTAPEPPPFTPCHGDYTPGQVLTAGPAVGVVDFDTVAWADPASDLGRYIATVELLVAKRVGEPQAELVAAVSDALLAGYLSARPDARRDAGLRRRMYVHRTLSLIRSATRSCLQLKDGRLAIALALLDSTDDPTGGRNP
jgi:hypothetical protein